MSTGKLQTIDTYRRNRSIMKNGTISEFTKESFQLLRPLSCQFYF